jgi:GH24 family phage-related lysozyme (muramidase)
MAKNKWSSDAFKKAQNLLSPGYNQADTFEAVTTLSKEDANALARSMKLDTGVTGYGNTPFDDNQASMNAYFPSINQPEPEIDQRSVDLLPEAETIPLDLYNEPAIAQQKLRSKLEEQYFPEDPAFGATTYGKPQEATYYLRDKYNEIFNNGSSSSTMDNSKVTAGMPQDTADDLTTYMDFVKGEEGFSATPYKLPGEKHNTIGYGHYGTDVQDDLNLTKRQANNILRNDIEIRLDEIQEAIPEFETLPMEVKKNLLGSWFRGSLGGSPKTIKLINEGKFDQAAKEFLNNDEYRTTKLKGVKKRMRATANALRKLK